MGKIKYKKKQNNTMTAIQRLSKEIIALKRLKERDQNMLFEAYPIDDNMLLEWEAIIEGPENSPYEKGKWKLSMSFPERYPMEAPQLRFETPIAHPNVGEDGDICLDILDSEWTPGMKIEKVLLSLISLLTDPNPDSPMREDLASLYSEDFEEYEKEIRQHTDTYALEKSQK